MIHAGNIALGGTTFRRDWVTCILCGHEGSGRHKEVQATFGGGYGDIILCPKVSIEIGKEMEAYLQKKRRRLLYLDGIEEDGEPEDEIVEVAFADVQAKRKKKNATPKVEKIEDIGRDNVVQVVTDNGANYKALWVIDGDEKLCNAVWALMNHAKERIKQSFNIPTKDGLLKKIMEIIERRWVKQMDHPLYGVALYLNPGNFFPLIKANDDVTVGQLRGCFIEVLGRMIPDVETQMKINRQAIEYEEQRGEAFSNKMAKESYDKMNPRCERCWSTFSHMHTKKRNRLLHKRLNDIVFVSYNRKMRTRFQLRREKADKKYDPLVIEEFDWDNEWADSLHVPASGARGSDLC
ncbi:unnamed protein product [Miscanthus lutarioriparius]|uniref:Uncharacterized protein n=1 Tax=Miscanthus lutarioriparius TaxID=422564 RepID=A0A811P267_9POAL|nr:unnamed protein product [Miscanthus lutarioriparius]